MTPPAARALRTVPTGNTFDKYGSKNPVVRRLVARFAAVVGELLTAAAPDSVLDVGCGEGVLTYEWARRMPSTRFVGLDLPDARLEAQWMQRSAPNLQFRTGAGESLTFSNGEFDLVAAIETLEHVRDPAQMLGQMARVARSHLLISVPREPMWRGLNVARGAYLPALGNTPGHVNHFSKRRLTKLLEVHGEIAELRSPLPWTVALVRVA